jgi:hypothetical protein
VTVHMLVHLSMATATVITVYTQVIKCWDAGTFTCLQTFPEHHTYRPDNCVTAMYWDAQRSALIAAGNRCVCAAILVLLLVLPSIHYCCC